MVTGVGQIGSLSVDQLIAESPKLAWTVDTLQTIFASGEKVILFTKYKKMQAMLAMCYGRNSVSTPTLSMEK